MTNEQIYNTIGRDHKYLNMDGGKLSSMTYGRIPFLRESSLKRRKKGRRVNSEMRTIKLPQLTNPVDEDLSE